MREKITSENNETDYYISFLNGIWMWFKLNKVVKSGNATSMTYANLAEIYSTYGLNKKALKYVLRALRLNKRNTRAYMVLGRIKTKLTANQCAAKKYYQKVLEIGGECEFEALGNLTFIALNEGELEKAVNYKKKFLAIQKESCIYIYYRTYMNFWFGEFEASCTDLIPLFKQCVKEKRFPFLEITKHLINLGICFINQSQYKLAKAPLLMYSGREEEALDVMINRAAKCKDEEQKVNIYSWLLDFYDDRGEYKKCLDAANRILIKDKCVEVFKYKALAYTNLEEYDKAIEVVKQMRGYDVDNQYNMYDFDIGLICYLKNDYEKAISHFNKQILANPTGETLTYKGFCLEETACYDEALKSYSRAVEQEPNDICYYRIATLYYRINDYENALENINRSLMLCKDSFNYNLKGDILTSLKRIKEARDCYKKAEGLE